MKIENNVYVYLCDTSQGGMISIINYTDVTRLNVLCALRG